MNQRKHISPQQKVIILREHLENQIPLSALSENHDVHINLLYRWKKELFEGAAEIFTAKQKKQSASEVRSTERLSEKLREKDTLIAELVQDNIELKKVSLATVERLLGRDGRSRQCCGLRRDDEAQMCNTCHDADTLDRHAYQQILRLGKPTRLHQSPQREDRARALVASLGV